MSKKKPTPRQILDFAIATEDNELAALVIVTGGIDYMLLLQQQSPEPLDIPALLNEMSRLFNPQPTPTPARVRK